MILAFCHSSLSIECQGPVTLTVRLLSLRDYDNACRHDDAVLKGIKGGVMFADEGCRTFALLFCWIQRLVDCCLVGLSQVRFAFACRALSG